MKKFISLLLAIVTILSISVQSLANSSEPDTILDEKIIEMIDGDNNGYNRGLIIENSLNLAKTSSQLVITATTVGELEVTKCGFNYVRLQRLVNGTWTNYSSYTYSNVYDEDDTCIFSARCTVPSGYSYRVICEHYAEKPKLIFFKDTETIYNYTSAISF